MRTKNKIWVVPILALVPVLALAAFLVAGSLPGGNGVPTAEAQGFPTATDATGSACEADVQETTTVEGGPCTTKEGSLDVSLFADGSDAAAVRVYVTGGTDYPNVQASDTAITEALTADPVVNNNQDVAAANRLGKKGVDRHTVSILANSFSEKRGETITVTSSMGDSTGAVYLFVYTAAGDATNGNITRAAKSLDGAAAFGIKVQFLTPPAVGMDGPDRNSIIEDYMQCIDDPENATPADTTAYASGARDGDAASCSGGVVQTGDITDTSDRPELRSKLVAHVAAGTGTGTAGTSYVLDGKSADLTLASDQNSATVHAIISDQGDNPSPGAEVTFEVSSEPAGIVSSTRTEDAKTVIASVTDANTQILDPGINTVNNQAADADVDFDNIVPGDALASRTISNLPATGFRVMVKVTADGVEIGTINIVRNGDPATIEAGIYPYDGCVTPSTSDPPVRTEDMLNLKDDDCAMDMRYGREQMFVVDATVKDSTWATSLTGETVSVEIGDAAVLSENDPWRFSCQQCDFRRVHGEGVTPPMGMSIRHGLPLRRRRCRRGVELLRGGSAG